jgi:predicted DNA-binding helix-hairpin-helix protein
MALQNLAPQKSYPAIFRPMNFLSTKLLELQDGNPKKKLAPRAPRFIPAGQSTQMIVGATPESDLQILSLASGLYHQQRLKRVYYSGYIPVNSDSRLPALRTPPLKREHRLYQADWLMRFYGFAHHEILEDSAPFLDPDFDPKMAWALRHIEQFPVDINTAPYEMLLRVPGIGVRSAKLIWHSRKRGTVRMEHLKKMGVALKRARFFLSSPTYPEQIRNILLLGQQTELFGGAP